MEDFDVENLKINLEDFMFIFRLGLILNTEEKFLHLNSFTRLEGRLLIILQGNRSVNVP